ncbi:Nicotinamidase-related amidase [Desulfonispora thiosulfatigenes DSM 11270]|uniref:Nicotinamidase-related amidase n=1 Tax=Desulfonispora thiosulfatigenes DSM 11270 TaxID=656914 RepID=A0A1W1UYG2_DESTI|nr:hydrolase [Desulfonispora thiosulfatigenes]SMB86137.1 Nicotinamidase-related amidase [Desulfonispora thiosulfatigenes DSM 11270]
MDKFTLKKDETVLLVIDIQERLVPAMKSGDQVINKTNILLQAATNLGIPVLVTEQYPKGLGKTVEEVSKYLNQSKVFEKTSFSACIPEVVAELKGLGRKKVIIAGMETHVCVFQTVRDLLAHGYEVFVTEDAISSRTGENKQNGLNLMSHMGAVVTNTETIIFDLLKKAGTPEFKVLSKLIK